VRPERELVVRDLPVVEDPARTSGQGAWTFAHLAAELAPPGVPPGAFVEAFLRSWLVDQTVNGFTVRARPSMQAFALDPWPRDASGLLDLARAPVRLLAIVDRVDLRDPVAGSAGEGRFVFGLLDRAGRPAPFTMIFEYRLRAGTEDDVRAWARAWHALGALPFPSEAYNAALQSLTDRFVSRGAGTCGAGGSALLAVRTNEAALDFTWELRQFALSPTDGALRPVPVDQTPDTGFLVAGSPVVADFVNQADEAILAGTFTVPPSFEGAPFLGGSSFNLLEAWNAPGIVDPEARHLFSLATCNGCHGDETGSEFLQIFPRPAGAAARISGFLRGIAVSDPFTGAFRTFADLQRRKADLEGLVCAGCAGAGQGLRRVH
jgi:hypothetical protein